MAPPMPVPAGLVQSVELERFNPACLDRLGVFDIGGNDRQFVFDGGGGDERIDEPDVALARC